MREKQPSGRQALKRAVSISGCASTSDAIYSPLQPNPGTRGTLSARRRATASMSSVEGSGARGLLSGITSASRITQRDLQPQPNRNRRTADYAATRGCATSSRPYLSARIRVIRGLILCVVFKQNESAFAALSEVHRGEALRPAVSRAMCPKSEIPNLKSRIAFPESLPAKSG